VQEGRDVAAMVNTAAGVALHRQLFLVLHDEIARGALAAGDALPSEQSLCDQFGVSRITVRRALADLAEAGLIERRHGIGSFVTDELPPVRDTDVGSYVDELRKVEFVRRERRTGEPLMITEAWLPVGLADVVTEQALARAPLYRLLSDNGVTLGRLEHELTAEIAGPRTAGLLGTAIGSPLIRVNRVAFTTDAPHHFLSILLSPNRSRVILSQNLGDGSGSELAIAHDVLRPAT
jgi:GntR family transcriptional regulator